jgi:AraC-like DNA-binding protein
MGTVSIELVHEALLVAVTRGADVAGVLRQARIDEQLLHAPLARVSASAYARLWAVLADLLDDEFFGMDSHPMRKGSFRLLCQACASAETLEQALHRMLRFLGLVLDDFQGELHREAAFAVITLHDHGTMRRLFAYGTWFVLVHGLSCGLVRRRIPLEQLTFRSPAPLDDSHYRTRFCQNLMFDAPSTQMRFDARLLDLKLLETPATISAFVGDAPANLIVKYRNERSVSALIRRRLQNLPPVQWPELDELARGLCMSGTTLQRRLQAEGMNYQRLKDELRRDIAIDLLSADAFTVAEVATRTGFRETSAFHRAFKKWTGISPGGYRRGSDMRRGLICPATSTGGQSSLAGVEA